ncbi:MAG: hypothetical protein WCB79_00475 [Halobacteriota archaeon]
MAPPILTRACALLILATLAITVSFAGCLTAQPNNDTTSPAIYPVNVTHTQHYNYNGTSYLTGIIKNVGTQNLINVSLQAEGYANNTTDERGYGAPQTGINATIMPGETSPFMIKMLPVTSNAKTTLAARASASISSLPLPNARNTTANKSASRPVAQTAKKPDLYRIFPEYKLSSVDPYPLSIENGKTIFSNKTISVSGEVYNGGAQNVNSSVVAAALYKKDGNVLGVFVGISQRADSEKTAPFEIDIPRGNFPISSADVARTQVYAYELTN